MATSPVSGPARSYGHACLKGLLSPALKPGSLPLAPPPVGRRSCSCSCSCSWPTARRARPASPEGFQGRSFTGCVSRPLEFSRRDRARQAQPNPMGRQLAFLVEGAGKWSVGTTFAFTLRWLGSSKKFSERHFRTVMENQKPSFYLSFVGLGGILMPNYSCLWREVPSIRHVLATIMFD